MLPAGDVLIRVAYSAVNYKDALSMNGHHGVTKEFPHTPGIDAAGLVVESSVPGVAPGHQVIALGRDLGMNTWGGLSEYIRVPAEWIVPMPRGLDARAAMAYGTAGFTAAQAVEAIRGFDVRPSAGPIAVSGATGGVGSAAVAMLALLGYQVAAVTGKRSAREVLTALGATELLTREEVAADPGRPLLRGRFAGGVDTTGGSILSGIIRATQYRGVVAMCGLAQSPKFDITVYPFILRGVRLIGIDSAEAPQEDRIAIWNRIASDLRVPSYEASVREISLEEVPDTARAMRAGENTGRVIVGVSPHAT
jgi:alcohol dehydrogenase